MPGLWYHLCTIYMMCVLTFNKITICIYIFVVQKTHEAGFLELFAYSACFNINHTAVKKNAVNGSTEDH